MGQAMRALVLGLCLAFAMGHNEGSVGDNMVQPLELMSLEDEGAQFTLSETGSAGDVTAKADKKIEKKAEAKKKAVKKKEEKKEEKKAAVKKKAAKQKKAAKKAAKKEKKKAAKEKKADKTTKSVKGSAKSSTPSAPQVAVGLRREAAALAPRTVELKQASFAPRKW